MKSLCKLLFFMLMLACGSEAYAFKFKDDSSAIFLPPEMQNLAKASHNFSFFWKGMFLIDITDKEKALAYVEKLCELLKNEENVRDFYCRKDNFKQNRDEIADWLRDMPLRETMPTKLEFMEKSQAQLAMASLPAIPKGVMASLRLDPFGESEKLWNFKKQFFTAPAEWKGYFANPSKDTVMIPFAFKHPPEDVEQTKQFKEKIESLCTEESCPNYAVSGPHFAILVNQSRVFEDLSLVGILGVLFFSLLMFFLGRKRGLALLSLCLPLVPSLLIAVGITILIFGSIHGLTLAFGPSLVGLALDYGLHTKIHKGSKEAWSSNLFGLLTTMVGFVVLLFSKIPLIQQMMVFALVGLLVSFVLYYFLSQSKNAIWKSTDFPVFSFVMAPRKWEGPFVVLLLVAGFVLWAAVPLDLNLRNFDFRQEHQAELEASWWEDQKIPEILFSVKNERNKAFEYKEWAEENSILLQNWASYFPPESEIEKNRATWKNCNFLVAPEAKKFFEPARANDACKIATSVPSLQIPAYVEDYVSKNELLSVWFPKSQKERELIESFDPSVTSLRRIFENFPKILLREIWLMFPIGTLMCFLLIYYHVRRVSYSLLALLPMLSAVGFTLLLFAIGGKSLSFISCIALLMIFGSSVDYGIFQIDSLTRPASEKSASETFSSIFMQALVTLVGYLPMLFAKHPVLSDMGWVLTLGTVGAFLGGVWGLPYLIKRIPKGESLK